MQRPTVRRTLDLDCTTADLWRLVTSPDELGAWIGHDVSLELHPGGAGHLIDDDGIARHLAVGEVVEGERLAFTWWPEEDDSAASEVTFAIEPTGEGARLVVTETAVGGVAAGVAGASAASASSWDVRLISLWLTVCSQARV